MSWEKATLKILKKGWSRSHESTLKPFIHVESQKKSWIFRGELLVYCAPRGGLRGVSPLISQEKQAFPETNRELHVSLRLWDTVDWV